MLPLLGIWFTLSRHQSRIEGANEYEEIIMRYAPRLLKALSFLVGVFLISSGAFSLAQIV